MKDFRDLPRLTEHTPCPAPAFSPLPIEENKKTRNKKRAVDMVKRLAAKIKDNK